MRLLVVDVEVVGGNLVIRHHGATLRERVELVVGVVCCVLCSQAGGDER